MTSLRRRSVLFLWLICALPVLAFAAEVTLTGPDDTNTVRRAQVTSEGKLAVAVGSANTSAMTTEVLILASGSTLAPGSSLSGRRAIELQNLGPNAIFCAVGTTPTLNKSRKLSSVGSIDSIWALDLGSSVPIRCIAATADQVTGAALIVTEIK